MRTDDFRPSDNVEDDREESASRGGISAGGAGGLGIGTIIIIGLISWYFGIDPSVLLNGAQILTGGTASREQTSPAPPVASGTPTDATGKFVALVLGDTEDRWTEIFAASGQTYHPPKLRLFARSEPTPAPSRSRPWGRSTARAISASISTPRSLTICRTSSAAARTARPASFPKPM